VEYIRHLKKITEYFRHRPHLYQILAAVFAISLLYLFGTLRFKWMDTFPTGLRFGFDILFLGISGWVVYSATGRLGSVSVERDQLKLEVSNVNRLVQEARERQKTFSQINQMFADARDEDEIIELVLHLSIDSIGAKSASLVPLDERSQPLQATSAGEMPFPAIDAWVEYLASPEVRKGCASCQKKENLSIKCPLLKGSFLDSMGIYCIPIKRGDREYGVLNLYLPREEGLDQEAQRFLSNLAEETGFALERVRLRQRELATLRQLQAVREKADLKGLLDDLLKNLGETLEADFVQLCAQELGGVDFQQRVTYGDIPEHSRPLIDGIIQSVISTGSPVLLGDVGGDSAAKQSMRSLMVVPLLAEDQSGMGALVVANRRGRSFSKRKLSLAQTVAGQVALVVQNVNSAAELEYKTIVQERTRLAREIHDGLAQTLGFLKLKMAQMKNYIDQGEQEKLRQTISVCYHSLSEAYQDARQAIDGLRISHSDLNIKAWLLQTVADFESNTGVRIEICSPFHEVELAPEVNAQLIRIVQEALSNVRKHSDGTLVEISSREYHGALILEIMDDGVGFYPEDVTITSQYGLKGMRERAELIGADFQVISRPGEGTTIRIRLPLGIEEGVK